MTKFVWVWCWLLASSSDISQSPKVDEIPRDGIYSIWVTFGRFALRVQKKSLFLYLLFSKNLHLKTINILKQHIFWMAHPKLLQASFGVAYCATLPLPFLLLPHYISLATCLPRVSPIFKNIKKSFSYLYFSLWLPLIILRLQICKDSK